MQQTLREERPGVGPVADPADPSRPNPITGRMLVRVLAIASVVAVFLSLFGLFDQPIAAIAKRTAQYFAYSWIGSTLGLVSARIVWRLGLWPQGVAVIGLATGLIMAPPMMLVVMAGSTLVNGHAPGRGMLGAMLWQTVLICVGSSLLTALVSRRARPGAAAAPGPPKFLERLPLKLRGAEVWAVQAEDHYLRLHTSKGQDLILMRLSDAIAELEGLEGAQVHRSWWVARGAIADARRGDGRATLILQDGAEVPVSRTYARMLRERNWI